jgi:hypothetical protein
MLDAPGIVFSAAGVKIGIWRLGANTVEWEVARAGKRALLMQIQTAKASRKNNMNILAGSFGRWRRCSLVADHFGYAPRSRLASGQNSCAIIVHVIFS